MSIPIRTLPAAISVEFTDYPGMIEAFRAIKDHIAISNADLDALCNFGSGHCDKLLGPTGAKGFGKLTLDAMLWALAIKGTMTIDMDRVVEMQAHWEKRCAGNTRAVPNRISRKLIERAKPEIFSEMGKLSAAKRMLCSTAQQRIKIARKAARKSGRLNAKTPKERSDIAKKAAGARWSKRNEAAVIMEKQRRP